MSEPWLAELFKISLSRFGVTTLPFDTIEAVSFLKECQIWKEWNWNYG